MIADFPAWQLGGPATVGSKPKTVTRNVIIKKGQEILFLTSFLSRPKVNELLRALFNYTPPTTLEIKFVTENPLCFQIIQASRNMMFNFKASAAVRAKPSVLQNLDSTMVRVVW
jgi:hypothetical protein